MTVQRILPDPFNAINPQGNVGGSNAVGFANVTVSSKQDIMKSRTNSGVTVTRAASYHMFNVGITYNPMSKSNFDLVYGFLLEKQASLKPFFVQLPQYSGTNASNKLTITDTAAIGETQLRLTSTNAAITVGSMFNIVDSSGSPVNNHTKAYQIVRVETSGNLHTDTSVSTATDPGSGQTRITFTPSLFKAVTTSEKVEIGKPKVQVLQTGNTQQYALNSDNLYSLSAKFEEVCF